MTDFYPDQSTILPMTTIRRERRLPRDVVGGVEVREGDRVSAVSLVAQGVRSNRYVLLDLGRALGVSDPEKLADLLQVELGDLVKEGDVLAGRGRQMVRSPVRGTVTRLVGTRLVLAAGLGVVEVRARFNALVASVRSRSVLLETTGALVQGVWGNGKSHFGALKLEPKEGLVNFQVDEFSTEWRGALVLTTQPLTRAILRQVSRQHFGGIIAPSMPAPLREFALGLKIPIMLTEGFGREPMNTHSLNVLQPYDGRQAALNADLPDRWAVDRPELIVPLRPEDAAAPPALDEPLRIGSEVRITRQPHLGAVGKVRNLPKSLRVIDNGLRVPVADVQFSSGRMVTVPLANLELFGRG
jgi:hypothetical protein